MLILTRRVGETLIIGDDVTVTVLGVKGNQVRIVIHRSLFLREEIYQRINKSRRRNKLLIILKFSFQMKKKYYHMEHETERWPSG